MWHDLVTTALLGTERRDLKLDGVGEPFRELAAQLADAPPERALLALAGAQALYRRAGGAPGIDATPLLEPCPPDTLPPCSPRAGLLLWQTLTLGQHAPHRQEWISLAARVGQRVSEDYLPLFLTTFERTSGSLPNCFYDVLGERGRWLARQNPAWAYAALPTNDAEWETAALAARLEYLRRARAADAAHGRALVEGVWSSENAETRGALLQAFEVGLSGEDEPFLEAALDDRARSVGAQAAAILTRLEGSALQRRMIERAKPLIRIGWKRQMLGRKLVIDAALPEVCDESMIRDGIDPKPNIETQHDTRAFWLGRIALALPVSHWLGDGSGWSPAELAQAACEIEDGATRSYVTSALAQAAQRERNDALGLALLENDNVAVGLRAMMLRVLPQAAGEQALMKALAQARPSDGANDIFQLLALVDTPYVWSAALTAALLGAVARVLPQMSAVQVMSLLSHFQSYAARMSPACIPNLQALAAVENKHKAAWGMHIRRIAGLLEFRRDMHKEFSR